MPRSKSLLRRCFSGVSLGTFSQTMQPNGGRNLSFFLWRGFPYYHLYGISSSIAKLGNQFLRYVAVFIAEAQKEFGIFACASIARTMLLRVQFMPVFRIIPSALLLVLSDHGR